MAGDKLEEQAHGQQPCKRAQYSPALNPMKMKMTMK